MRCALCGTTVGGLLVLLRIAQGDKIRYRHAGPRMFFCTAVLLEREGKLWRFIDGMACSRDHFELTAAGRRALRCDHVRRAKPASRV